MKAIEENISNGKRKAAEAPGSASKGLKLEQSVLMRIAIDSALAVKLPALAFTPKMDDRFQASFLGMLSTISKVGNSIWNMPMRYAYSVLYRMVGLFSVLPETSVVHIVVKDDEFAAKLYDRLLRMNEGYGLKLASLLGVSCASKQIKNRLLIVPMHLYYTTVRFSGSEVPGPAHPIQDLFEGVSAVTVFVGSFLMNRDRQYDRFLDWLVADRLVIAINGFKEMTHASVFPIDHYDFVTGKKKLSAEMVSFIVPGGSIDSSVRKAVDESIAGLVDTSGLELDEDIKRILGGK